ncbi:MFS transporter, DHA1 family, multidrug resistance protein B [Thermoactinomyces sp. DSM 45891]|uniref:MFS transporter n=1 Tax=Thermoactinomyces sp. DSM 45891 TaxID=1761907 RepID=UPI000911A227|nr:MFS transporter [Thermoactinomyces sp. DSM 45891]SFX71758.1 MFS transporter, DHA1 family, multidrug resistance protein B [Thermoactinomyces sp. DSM 45891]
MDNLLKLHINVKIRLIDQFLRSLAFNILTPFMIIYFSGYLGAFNTGVILMCNLVLSFIAGLYGGHFADNWGRKKLLLWAGSIRLITTSIMAIAVSINLPMLVLGMVTLNSLCIGASRPAGSAMIADSSQPEERKFIYTVDYWLFNFSMVIGATLGGFLFERYLFELILGIATSALTSLLLIIFFIQDTYTPSPIQNQVKKSILKDMILNYRSVLKDNVFRVFIFANLLNISVQTQTMDYIAIRLKNEMEHQTLFTIGDFSFAVNGINMFGLLYSINSFLIIILGLFTTRLFKKLSTSFLLKIGIILYSVGFTVLAISNNPYLLIFSEFLIVAGELMYIPILQSLMVDIIPPESRGAYMATNEFGNLGALMLGSLAVSLGAIFPTWTMGGIILFCGIISLFLLNTIPVTKKTSKTPVEISSN